MYAVLLLYLGRNTMASSTALSPSEAHPQLVKALVHGTKEDLSCQLLSHRLSMSERHVSSHTLERDKRHEERSPRRGIECTGII